MILLLDIQFRTTLLRLARIMLLLGLELGLTVASESGDSTTHGTSQTICSTGAQVVELALRFLGLTAGILFLALFLEIL